MSRCEARRQIVRFVGFSACGWIFMPLAAGLGILATKTDGIDLYIFSGLLLLGVSIAAFTWAVAMSFVWTNRAILTFWAIRNSEIGPWSGRTTHVIVWLALLAFQVCGVGLIGLISWGMFPDYPAGWP